MKYYIIAGEASGDLHGSNLIKAIQEQDRFAEFRVWGGDKMNETGATMVSHYKEMSFMGFVGVVSNIFKIIKRISFCKKDILEYQPHALIFIDFSGFNLRIAKWARASHFKKFYYISPQVWASRSGRINIIKSTIDRMFCILPFEKEFYSKYNFDVEFVGHPLIDEVESFKINPNFIKEKALDGRPVIALLPGSRSQEIKSVLSVMAMIIPRFTAYQFVIAAAPAINDGVYASILNKYQLSDIKLIRNQTYDLLSHAQAAIVTSGTATLETALFKVPQVVVYKGNVLNYIIAKWVIQVDYISLVNLISQKEIVKEIIQKELTIDSLEYELHQILSGSKRESMVTAYTNFRKLLGTPGAAKRTARQMVDILNSKQT